LEPETIWQSGKLLEVKVNHLTILTRTMPLSRNGRANSYLQNELKVQTSEAFIDLAAIRLMLNGSPRGKTSFRGCLKSPANSNFTESAIGFTPAVRKLE